ncbi:hypothetical protein Q9295_05495 [Xinfangfangia sp. CPCC 101601]|uniref:Porin n=1 Tax=Pseudogemmobacter lacusdianii TaxID=3069608 RepID=A0ABU0VVN7_9RHOB|nr:hypothetical protein [Xinfangfangia sp. CPCC 101601]MDQ2065816.1 hypothetical protein [Xinfangfangia sp. CPCC 101601]
MKLTSTFLSSLVVFGAASSVQAQDWASSVETGFFATDRFSDDTDIGEAPFYGVYIAADTTRDFGALKFSLDARLELMSDKGIDDVYQTGPLHTGVIGAHLGRQLGATYLGGYAAFGLFDGYDSEDPMKGYTIGVEAEHQLVSGISLFGQVGYAEAIGDEYDNEFKGTSARIGVAGDLNSAVSYQLAAEYAYSADCFEDCGDQWGRYTAVSLEVSYDLSEKMELVGVARHAKITANRENKAEETNLYVGVRIPFGATKRNNLTTPMGAFQGAGWMQPLD